MGGNVLVDLYGDVCFYYVGWGFVDWFMVEDMFIVVVDG